MAAALTSLLLGLDPGETVGLGAGGDSATLDRKRRGSLSRRPARPGAAEQRPSPLEALGAVGGPEFVVLAGVVLGAAQNGRAVVIDGLATSVAALCAVRLEPGAAAHLVAGQRSRETAHGAVLGAARSRTAARPQDAGGRRRRGRPRHSAFGQRAEDAGSGRQSGDRFHPAGTNDLKASVVALGNRVAKSRIRA